MQAPSSVPEVVAHLRQVEASAPRGDGVACFARLYREVSEGVDVQLVRNDYADPRFLERLDVAFAGLFFDALEAHERDPGTAPRAWAPLFAARSLRGVAPLQFALAGMNAHINRDLPVALVSTCGELGLDLSERSPEHGDFERVNALLERVEVRVKASYLTGPLGLLDRLVHRFDRLDDVLAMWDIRRARDAAWTNGEALWALRGQSTLRDRFMLALDRMVGLAGRGLLVPADSLVQELARRLRRGAQPPHV